MHLTPCPPSQSWALSLCAFIGKKYGEVENNITDQLHRRLEYTGDKTALGGSIIRLFKRLPQWSSHPSVTGVPCFLHLQLCHTHDSAFSYILYLFYCSWCPLLPLDAFLYHVLYAYSWMELPLGFCSLLSLFQPLDSTTPADSITISQNKIPKREALTGSSRHSPG